MSALAQANSFFGNLVRLALVALLGTGAYIGWRTWHADVERVQAELAKKQVEIDRLAADLAVKQKEIDRLALALRLLKVDRRIARVVVLEQEPGRNGSRGTTKARFEEIDDAGNPIGAMKEFTIEGDLLYVDALVVKFEDLFVEQGDLMRGHSLVQFRRIFGEHQAPNDGVVIDAPGARPAAYGGDTRQDELEQQLWRDFWEIANDPKRAAALGVRAAHGEANSMKLKKGAVYTITARSSGGLTIQPDRVGGSN